MEAERWPWGCFPGIGNATGEEFLAAWAVMDPVHVVVLAAGKVDERHTPVEVAWSVYLCCTIPFTPSSIAQTDSRVLQSPQSPQGPTMFSSRRCMIHHIDGMAGGETFGGVLQKQIRVAARTFRSADSKDAYHVVIGAHQMNPRVM